MKFALPEKEFAALSLRRAEIAEALVACGQSHRDALDALEKVKSESQDAMPMQELETQKKTADEELKKLQQESGAIQEAIRTYNKQQKQLAELRKVLDDKLAEFNRWNVMRTWFGKADGSDFVTFVQGLTFRSLLSRIMRRLNAAPSLSSLKHTLKKSSSISRSFFILSRLRCLNSSFLFRESVKLFTAVFITLQYIFYHSYGKKSIMREKITARRECLTVSVNQINLSLPREARPCCRLPKADRR